MFISDTHLPQYFSAKAYHDQEWYDREKQAIFLPSWHLVATTAEFPTNGSYRTLDMFGRPILLRREGSDIHGFLNVCSHRNSKLTTKSRGCSKVIKCGYHGWEYHGSTGATQKIPDAPSFKPRKNKGHVGLAQVQVAVYGGLVFVSLESHEPPFGGLFEKEFASIGERNLASGNIGMREVVCPVNWKAAVENTLESYHVSEVHPKTFRVAPVEDDCSHQMFEDGSTFMSSNATPWLLRKIQTHALRKAGLPLLENYRHVHLHPMFTVAETDSFAIFLSFLPEGPKQTRTRIFWFAPQNEQGNRFRNAIVRQISKLESGFWLRVTEEDFGVLPMVQQGLDSAAHTSEGLISRREERIPHFQKWVLRKLGEPIPDEG